MVLPTSVHYLFLSIAVHSIEQHHHGLPFKVDSIQGEFVVVVMAGRAVEWREFFVLYCHVEGEERHHDVMFEEEALRGRIPGAVLLVAKYPISLDRAHFEGARHA